MQAQQATESTVTMSSRQIGCGYSGAANFSVYGAPETFVIDKQGVIRYKQIGPITPEALEKKILPLIRELNA